MARTEANMGADDSEVESLSRRGLRCPWCGALEARRNRLRLHLDVVHPGWLQRPIVELECSWWLCAKAIDGGGPDSTFDPLELRIGASLLLDRKWS
jgi:hypothetical protein